MVGVWPLKRRHAFILLGSDRFPIVGPVTWSLCTANPRESLASIGGYTSGYYIDRQEFLLSVSLHYLQSIPSYITIFSSPSRHNYGIIRESNLFINLREMYLNKTGGGIISQSVVQLLLYAVGNFLDISTRKLLRASDRRRGYRKMENRFDLE